MCGITGLLHLDGTPADSRSIHRMVETLDHRGPDDSGLWLGGPVGFGHTRLSIIDLSGGRQPMQTADARLTVTFNGEIFNYIELRRDLLAKGRRFATDSDTEVILHLYDEYGPECVRHMNGQWAFAVWDVQKRELFLSRDRLGIRPLYYTTSGQKLLFASEIKALLTNPSVRRELDPIALDQLFTFWAPLAPRTVFRGISELPPGHNLLVRDGRLHLEQYWQLDFSKQSSANADELAEQLFELLEDATRLRLRSDVPVGAYLSGGLDSSITTALVKRLNRDRLCTFSVEFADPEFDESRYQGDVVRLLGTEHRTVVCTHDDIARVFPQVIRHSERPVLRTAPAPLLLLSQLVRESGFKVVLTGEGADEVLGGYDIFKEARIRRFWARQPDSRYRPLLLKRLYPYLRNLHAQSPAYLKAFFQVRPRDLASPFFSHLPRWDMTSKLKSFFTSDVRGAIADYDALADLERQLPSRYFDWDSFAQAQYLETTGLLPGYILSSQGDRVAMAHSVEGRFPFLDYRLVEFAATIPPRLKMRGLDEKHILKRAAGDLVPDSVRQRPKQPYRAPDARSFFDETTGQARQPYVEDLLSADAVRRAGLFDPSAVERLVMKAKSGGVIGTKDNMALVGILSTQLLAEQFLHGRTVEADRATENQLEPVSH